jgi:phosphatidate phosphatase APP1
LKIQVFVMTWICAWLMVTGVLAAEPCQLPPSRLASDEEVLFYPTFASLDAAQQTWWVRVRGWVYEPERNSAVREAGIQALSVKLGLDGDAARSEMFRERVWPLIADSERGKSITVQLGDACYAAGTSDVRGYFDSIQPVRVQDAPSSWKPGAWVPVEVVMPEGDRRSFAGKLQLVGPVGISVITDIDDTIRISEVKDRKKMLERTFLREFEAVPGMSELYGRWAAGGAAFHHVSATPWRFFPPLAAFLEAEKFPPGSWHLRTVGLSDPTLAYLLMSPVPFKTAEIAAIFEAFPNRRFVLVGDSGEKDCEIYGRLARSHPERVLHVYIRVLDKDPATMQAVEEGLAGVARALWSTFEEASEIDLKRP